MTTDERNELASRIRARLTALNDDGLKEAFKRVGELSRLREYAAKFPAGKDKHIKIIRKGTAEITTGGFSSLKTGDQVYINGRTVVLTEDAHLSGDASYDGWLAYGGPGNDGIFPEDCDSPEVD